MIRIIKLFHISDFPAALRNLSRVSHMENVNQESINCLLGSLLLLLLLLLDFSFIFSRGFFLNWWRWGFFFLLFFLNCNKHTNDIRGLDHVILIDVKFSKNIINLSLGHLVSKGTQCILEHLGVNLAFIVKSATEVIFVKLPILVDVHHLEAVLVHLDLLLRESSFILTLAHLELLLFLWSGHNSPC